VTRLRLPYINEFKDRHGRVRRYARRPGRKAVGLPGAPGSPEFMEAYHTALAGFEIERRPVGQSRSASGSVSAAIAAYYQHNSFLHGLAPATQKMRRAILERFRAAHGDKRLARLQRAHIAAILGTMKPNAARNWLKTLRGLMEFCIDVGLLGADPTNGIKRARAPKTSGFHSWTEAEIAQYEAHHPVGTRARLAEALLLYTALRRGDIVRIGPQHFRDSRITLRKTARRTGKTLRIAVHPALAEVLAATTCTDLTYLVTAAGAPFTAAGFGNYFRECCDAAGLPHCTAHGLRKAMFRRIAEAGGSVHHLKGVGGHDTLSELQIYTDDADQAYLAQAAIELVATAFPAKTGTPIYKPSAADLQTGTQPSDK
jgi:integrase